MFDPNLLQTVALVSGPALLTNASALLLAGATNRFQAALDDHLRRPGGNSSVLDSISVSRRMRLSAYAVRALHLALIAFGINCMLLLSLTAAWPAAAPVSAGLNAAGLALEILGLASLSCGVFLLAAEGIYGFKSQSVCSSISLSVLSACGRAKLGR